DLQNNLAEREKGGEVRAYRLFIIREKFFRLASPEFHQPLYRLQREQFVVDSIEMVLICNKNIFRMVRSAKDDRIVQGIHSQLLSMVEADVAGCVRRNRQAIVELLAV